MNKLKTYADKYLKDGVTTEDLIREIEHSKVGIEIQMMPPQYLNAMIEHIRKLLNTPIKPTLTEDEKVILRNVSIDFRYIRREKNGELYFCVAENKGCVSNIFANGLFDCIQPRRRI